jgi:hypothetical protein
MDWKSCSYDFHLVILWFCGASSFSFPIAQCVVQTMGSTITFECFLSCLVLQIDNWFDLPLGLALCKSLGLWRSPWKLEMLWSLSGVAASKHSINNKSQTWPHIIPKRNAITKNSISPYHWVVNCTCICLLKGFIGGVIVSKWLWESFFFVGCSSNAIHFRF